MSATLYEFDHRPQVTAMSQQRFSKKDRSDQTRVRRTILIVVGLIAAGAVDLAYHVFNDNPCTAWLSSAYDRGSALDLYGDKAAAIAAFTEDLKSNPRHVEALQARGVDYGKLGQFALALADLTQALTLRPGNPDILIDRARVYQQEGAFDLAIADFSQAIRVAPRNLENWEGRGDAYLTHGDLDAAVADYSHVIATVDNKYVDRAYYARGIAYLRAGKFDLANADFTFYAAAFPGDTDAATAGHCARQDSNTGDCALSYPSPATLEAAKLVDRAERAMSGCERPSVLNQL
jgi:tetratricopeptide (TPR) repeat protein